MDRKWLVRNRLVTRLCGKVYLLLLNDAADIAIAEGHSLVSVLLILHLVFRISQNYSFQPIIVKCNRMK